MATGGVKTQRCNSVHIQQEIVQVQHPSLPTAHAFTTSQTLATPKTHSLTAQACKVLPNDLSHGPSPAINGVWSVEEIDY